MPIIRFLRRRIINASNTSGPPADDLNNDSCPLPSLLLPTVQLMQISNIIYLPVGGWSVRFCIPEVFFPLEDWGPVSSPGGYVSRQCFCNWNVKARKETLLFPPDFLKEKTFHEIFFRAAALAASPKKGVSAPEIFEQVRQKGEGGGDVSWGQKGKKKKRPPSVSPLLLLLDVWPVTVLTRSSTVGRRQRQGVSRTWRTMRNCGWFHFWLLGPLCWLRIFLGHPVSDVDLHSSFSSSLLFLVSFEGNI